MDWMRPLDFYCERLGEGLGEEPVNTLTNIAFLIAAWLAGALFRGAGLGIRRAPDIVALIVLIALIGIGSGLFHYTGTYGAMLADVVPIALFIYLGIGSALRRVLGMRWPGIALSLAAFAFLGQWAEGVDLPGLPPTTAGYIPPWLAVLALGWLAARRKSPAASSFAAAGGLFALSLTCRSLDLISCPFFSIGTHFLWHVFNAAVLYCIVKGLIRHETSRA